MADVQFALGTKNIYIFFSSSITMVILQYRSENTLRRQVVNHYRLITFIITRRATGQRKRKIKKGKHKFDKDELLYSATLPSGLLENKT
jgi:hypothetical protein